MATVSELDARSVLMISASFSTYPVVSSSFGQAMTSFLPFQEIRMKAPERKRRAVGGDEQVGVLEVRGEGRNQMELDRPLAELRAAGDGLFPVSGVSARAISRAMLPGHPPWKWGAGVACRDRRRRHGHAWPRPCRGSSRHAGKSPSDHSPRCPARRSSGRRSGRRPGRRPCRRNRSP